jgi:dTDP-4-amino-4,6-dideoxygalactose transaminase
MDYATDEQKESFSFLSKNPHDRQRLFGLEQNFINQSEKRLDFVCQVIKKSTSNSLVLFHKIAYGEKLYNKLISLRTHGITKENMKENHGGWFYEMQELGYNYRLTDIQSALGITQLAKNKKGVIRRNEIANAYKTAFRSKIKFQSLEIGSVNAHHLFVIEVEDRRGLYDHLKEQNIFAQIHYIPVHTLPYYKNIGYDGSDLINSEKYYANCISLPMYPTLTNEEQNFVIEQVIIFVNA